jgi:hypothetical protein
MRLGLTSERSFFRDGSCGRVQVDHDDAVGFLVKFRGLGVEEHQFRSIVGDVHEVRVTDLESSFAHRRHPMKRNSRVSQPGETFVSPGWLRGSSGSMRTNTP